jgi:anti-sigma factor RsiW
MDCRSARKNLSRYVDRELPDDLQRAFEDHFAVCPACRKETEELRSLLEIFVEPAAVPAPARLYGLIRDRLPDAEPVRRFPWWRPVLVPALAAAAFILTALASANLIPRIFVPPADRRLQVTSATLDLSVFHDAPGSTLAGAYDKVTGE